MATGNDLVSGALRTVCSLQPGEAIDGQETDNALAVMNMMLAAWSASNLMPAFRTLENFPLVAGQSSYTIGTGGNFNTVRPDEITYMFFRDANNADYKLESMTTEEYNAVLLKGLTGWPQWYFFDPGYALSTIYLYPADIKADTLFIESLKPFNQFTTLQTTLLMPGEYQETIKYQLVKRLAPEYGFSIPAGSPLADLIAESEKRLKSHNIKRKVANFDMPGTESSKPNIYNG